MFIAIKNQGEMDINALVLIGASSKRGDDSKIGYFGSGLKYSLAVLIRNGIMPKIFIGKEEVEISVDKKIFRGQSFDQILINGEPTSLTTDMGVDWEPWFAVREIYCNALDEGEASLNMVEDPDPKEGTTSIFIENTGIFDELLMNWDKYFNVRRPDCMLNRIGFKAYQGGEDYIIYRRGVRVHHEAQTKSLYHYDCSSIDINKSRTLRYGYDSTWHTADQVSRHADIEMIRNIYDNFEDKIEEHFRWDQASFNDTWLEVLGGRPIVIKAIAGYFLSRIQEGNVIVLPGALARALKRKWPKDVHIVGDSDEYGGFMVVDQTPRQQSYIDAAKQFLLDAGHDVHYPIKVAVFEDKNVLGQASGDMILLSVDVLEKGKRQTAITLLEEYTHLKYHHRDCSRSMQDFLFEKWFASFEEKLNIYL